MPYEKTMTIVIWWMEVVYIHWVMVANQGSGVSSKMLQGASHKNIFTFSPWIFIHYTGSSRAFNMRSLNMNAPRGYFPLQSMPSSQSQQDVPETCTSRVKRTIVSGFRTSVHHFKKHVGVGIICSVAYFDPYAMHLNVENRLWAYIFIRGNWSVDLQAGSTFGYRPMLFVILLTGLGAILFQVSHLF